LDEIHLVYIPTRDGSIGDVLLDILGIVLGLLLFSTTYAARFRKGREPKTKS